eukprot:11357108-Karenia_brevis.AAC.1
MAGLDAVQRQIQEMAALLQAAQQREAAMASEIQRIQGLVELPNVLAQVAASQKALLQATQTSQRSSASLVDVKGIGRPQTFNGKDKEKFLPWKTRIANFVGNVFPEMIQAFDWAEEQTKPIVEADIEGSASLI